MVRMIAYPHGKNIKSLAASLRARVSYLWLVWYLHYMKKKIGVRVAFDEAR